MSSSNKFSKEAFAKMPIVGIIRGKSKEVIMNVAEVYEAVGYSTLEVTMNTDNVEDIIRSLTEKHPNLNIGAGTVCTLDDLDKAVSAGAQYIVTPIIVEEVIEKTVALNIPIFPGAYSPTEIYKAWNMGATAVKVFPAAQLGTKYIKDVLAPLDNIRLLPTGGVNKENIASFFEIGAFGVGMGSSLFDAELIKAEDYEGLSNHLIDLKSEISAFVN